MSEWTVVGVIAALVALFFTVGTPVIKLNSAVTTLNNLVKQLGDCIEDLKESNKEQHRRMWEKIDSHADKLNEIEKALAVIQDKDGD